MKIIEKTKQDGIRAWIAMKLVRLKFNKIYHKVLKLLSIQCNHKWIVVEWKKLEIMVDQDDYDTILIAARLMCQYCEEGKTIP